MSARLMTRLFLSIIVSAFFSVAAAQQWPTPSGGVVGGSLGLCLNGSNQAVPCSSQFPLPIAGSFSATLGGWPGTTQTTGTPLSASTIAATGALPAGTVVLATNDGSVGAYCKLGASATANDQPVYPQSSVAFTVGSNTQITCITASGSTTIKLAGGSGLPTGWGGGSSTGGGGGAVTVANGADVNAGSTTDAAATAGSTGSMSAKLRLMTTQNASIIAALSSPFQAGGSIGNTGFNVLQGGTANAVGNPFFVSPGTGASWADTIADGADVNSGATTDAAATAGSTGSVSAKLRFMTTAANTTNTTLSTISTQTSSVVSNTANISTSLNGFTPNGTNTTLTATGTSADVALPGGTSFLIQNLGSTTVSCNFTVGAGTATANLTQVAPGAPVGIYKGPFTHISCIDQTGSASNLISIIGGSGVITTMTSASTGGGGSGGAVTVADGADVNAGATTDTAATAGGTGSLSAKMRLATTLQNNISTAAGTPSDTAYNGSGTASIIAALKGLYSLISGPIAAGTNLVGGFTQYLGTSATVDNPCQTVTQTDVPISITTATTTRVVAPASGKKTYICSIQLQAAGADNVGVVEGTGGTCGTGTAGVFGGTTAGSGFNLAANQGLGFGSGMSPVWGTAGQNVDFCLITSAAVNLAGHLRYVQK